MAPMILLPNDPRHGTSNGYRNHGCRCVRCREASTIEQRRLRANNEHPSAKARSYAVTKAATWVKNNHPDVWHQFYMRGVLIYGVGKVGAPKNEDA